MNPLLYKQEAISGGDSPVKATGITKIYVCLKMLTLFEDLVSEDMTSALELTLSEDTTQALDLTLSDDSP